MAKLRTNQAMQNQVRSLYSKVYTIRAIAKSQRISRNTVRAILRNFESQESGSLVGADPPIKQSGNINWKCVHNKVGRRISDRTP